MKLLRCAILSSLFLFPFLSNAEVKTVLTDKEAQDFAKTFNGFYLKDSESISGEIRVYSMDHSWSNSSFNHFKVDIDGGNEKAFDNAYEPGFKNDPLQEKKTKILEQLEIAKAKKHFSKRSASKFNIFVEFECSKEANETECTIRDSDLDSFFEHYNF